MRAGSQELGSRSSGYTALGLGPRAMCRSGIGCFAHHGPQAHIERLRLSLQLKFPLLQVCKCEIKLFYPLPLIHSLRK